MTYLCCCLKLQAGRNLKLKCILPLKTQPENANVFDPLEK